MNTTAATLRGSAAHVLLEHASDLDGDLVVLEEPTGHHLRRVLRLRTGAAITLTDGAGRWRAGELVLGDTATVRPTSAVVVSEPVEEPFTIAAAIPKGDRLDWMVQKVTECGADRLLLLECDRSVVRWSTEKHERQIARLQRIADEALRQSRRVHRLVIEGPVSARSVLGSMTVAEPGGVAPSSALRTVAIGPEGGWSDDERGTISQSVDLGATILRTETAAIVATALCVVRDH